MSDTKYIEGIFVGKEFMKEGSKKDGTAYKLHKYKFKVQQDSQYPFSVSVFSPFNAPQGSISPESLQDGNRYQIAYTEHTYLNQTNKEVTSKTGAGFYNAGTFQNTQQTRPTPQQCPPAQDMIKKLSEWADNYRLKLGNLPQKSPLHMMGSFLASQYKDQYWELYKKCCEELGDVPK